MGSITLLSLLLFSAVLLINSDGVMPQQSCGNYCSELEKQMSSKLEESKKEVDSIRNDLSYWQNSTLSILKKYLVDREGQCDTSPQSFHGENFEDCCNKTESILQLVQAMGEEIQSLATDLQELRSAQADELQQHREEQSRILHDTLLELRNNSASGHRIPLGTFLNPAPSCSSLDGSSGNYWLQNAGGTGYASLQYCDMSSRGSSSTVGYMRVANLDMSNSRQHCPPGFKSLSSPVRSCGSCGSGCRSVIYSVDGVAYSRVCGRIKGYQYGSPDGLSPYCFNRARTIDNHYVDGISLTYGKTPRKHIWTFIAGLHEHSDHPLHVCPCSSNFAGVVPPFIGQDYFCDTGSRNAWQSQWYTDDPLWDGAGCGYNSRRCCSGPPWFCKDLPEAITDDIELRLCLDEGTSNENIAIEEIEILVQ